MWNSEMGYSWCAAINCSNTGKTKDGKSFFKFPKEAERCKKWVIACRRADLEEKTPAYLYQNCTLCQDHFEDRCFLNDLKNRLQLHAVPSIFNFLGPLFLKRGKRILPLKRPKKSDSSSESVLNVSAEDVSSGVEKNKKSKKNKQKRQHHDSSVTENASEPPCTRVKLEFDDGSYDDSSENLSLEDLLLSRSKDPVASTSSNCNTVNNSVNNDETRESGMVSEVQMVAEVRSNGEDEHSVETFFRGIAHTVMEFPPHLIAETQSKVSAIVYEMKLLAEKERDTSTD